MPLSLVALRFTVLDYGHYVRDALLLVTSGCSRPPNDLINDKAAHDPATLIALFLCVW